MPYSAISKKDEKRFLHNLGQSEFLNQSLSFNEVIDLIQTNKIILEVIEDESTIIIDAENIEEIEKIVPHLLRIVNKPKSFITLHEEKVPVETAKRINHKAIMKLSQDSNDWHARTLLTIKPKNINADINEETFAIYENRFIVTLIDNIVRLLKEAKGQYSSKLNQYKRDRIGAKMGGYFTSPDQFKFLDVIKKNETFNWNALKIIDELEELIKRIENLERKIKILLNSAFYQGLRKSRRVKNPILKTNILMFSPDYKASYRLWNNLMTLKSMQTIDGEDSYDCENLFKLYTVFNLFVMFKDMGFVETTNNKVMWNKESEKISSRGTLVFKSEHDLIEMNIGNFIELKVLENKRPVDKWRYIGVYTDYTDFESLNKFELAFKTTEMLNDISRKNKKNKEIEYDAKYFFISTDLLRSQNEFELDEKLYKRFYSSGDGLSIKEEANDIEKWGSHKTGFVNITPSSLKSNLLRMERFLNTNIIPLRAKNNSNLCPICGSKHIKVLDSYIGKKHKTFTTFCKECERIYSSNYCSNCKEDLLWIKYADEKFLNDYEIIEAGFLKMTLPEQLNQLEVITGKNSITSFSLENENGYYKLKTICPHCMVQLGRTN